MEFEGASENSKMQIKTVEDGIVILKALANKNNDRWNNFFAGIDKSKDRKTKSEKKNKPSDEKISKLIKAQKKTEAIISELTDSVKAAHQRIDKIEE